MKKSVLKVLSVVMTVVMVLTGTCILSFAADEGTDISSTVGSLAELFANLKFDDLFALITSFLNALGFEGTFTGFQDMAKIADWMFASTGVLGQMYESFLKNIDTAQLVKIINGILAMFQKAA